MNTRTLPARRVRTAVRFITGQLDFDKPGTRKYIRHLKRRVKNGVLAMQERGHGFQSVVLRGVGSVRVWRKHWRVIGRIGAHRAAHIGVVRIGGRPVTTIDVHGPHRGTVGEQPQDEYYRELRAYTDLLTAQGRLWVVLGDFNRNHIFVGNLLGGTSVGYGVDGIVAGPGLKVSLVDVDRTGIDNGWTGHVSVMADVSIDLRSAA